MDGIAAAIYAPYNEPYEMTLLVSVDSGGQPGSTIWEATYTNQSNPYPSIFSAAVSNGPNLTAGTIYWLVAQNPTAGENAPGWNSNNQHDLGSFGYESDGTWTIYTNTERLGLRDSRNRTGTRDCYAAGARHRSHLRSQVGLEVVSITSRKPRVRP